MGEKILVESSLHNFLKTVSLAYLYKIGCFMVAEEIPLTRMGQKRLYELDNHFIIDGCGIGERFLPERNKKTFLKNILKGIEVKISRNDFWNGFICSGCNYNYVLTPMRLVSPKEVPRGVGLLEYNKFKFDYKVTKEGELSIKGLRLVKKPRYVRIPQYQIDNATMEIACRYTGNMGENIFEKMDEAIEEHVYRS
jgi:hypothetical protein